MVQSRVICSRCTDVLWNIDNNWSRPARARQVKSFSHNAGKIACLTHEIVVLHARPSDADSVHFLKCVSSDQVSRDLSSDYDDGRRIHVCVGDARDRIRSTWARRDEHHAYTTGGTRVTLSHVDRALFMPDKVMRDSIAGAPEFIVNVKYCAARIAKDRIYAFEDEGVDKHLGASWPSWKQISRRVTVDQSTNWL